MTFECRQTFSTYLDNHRKNAWRSLTAGVENFLGYFNPFSPAKAPNLAELCNPITRQAIELESYPNHPWIQQVL